MVCRRGCFPCIERRSFNDGVVGKGAIDDEETNLLGELLRVHSYGHWLDDGPDKENFGIAKSY